MAINRDTTFGREHGFADIARAQTFRERVPVQQYEMLRPYIERQRRTGEAALTTEAPLFYAQTSGTTGTPKYIPITPASLAMHRAEQALFSYLQFRACPQAFDGMAMGIMGAAVEDHLDSGHAVGSVSGHLYASLPRFIQSRFVVPPAVSTISDYELKYQIILHLALAQPNITYIGSPNPSTFLRLLDLLNRHREVAAACVGHGHIQPDRRTRALVAADRGESDACDARARRAAAEAGRTHLCQCLARREVADDVDGWKLRNRARRAPKQAANQHARHGVGLSGDRSPRNDSARSRNGRAASHPFTTPSSNSSSSQPGNGSDPNI